MNSSNFENSNTHELNVDNQDPNYIDENAPYLPSMSKTHHESQVFKPIVEEESFPKTFERHETK